MPFDGQHLEAWQRTLLMAAEIVRERWNPSGYGRHGGPRCALGAIDEAASALLCAPHPAACHLLDYLDYIATPTIPEWNDAPGRTAEDVAATMERVALGETDG